MQDIQRGDRSIRNIPVPATHRHPTGKGEVQQEYEEYENDEADLPPPRRPKVPHRRRWRPWGLLGGVVVACAIIGLLLSTVFEGATVTLTPKTVAVTVPQTLTAVPNGPTGSLLYQTITATQYATTSVNANGSQQVSRAATGMVTLFNTYSAAPQSLVANTRLTTTDGKIYRIKDAVTIPGVVTKADGSQAPGTVTVSVTADKPGADYNQSAPIQMNIVGFKGSPKYTKFLAQSQGSIGGGLVGNVPAAAPADMANAQNTLKQQLDASIRSAAVSQVPDGFVAVNGSLGVTYTDINQSQGSGSSITLSEGVTATVAILRVADLANALAKQAFSDYKGEPVAFADLSKVTVSLVTSGSSNMTGPLAITVGGTPTLVWQFDHDALKQALLGKNKSDFPSIIKGYEPAVAKAEASIRPFWKATFPSNPDKLTVLISQ